MGGSKHPSAAEADIENRTVIAAVTRCATQKQKRKEGFRNF